MPRPSPNDDHDFDDPIEQIASHWDANCSSVSLQRWNPETQKFALAEKFPSPPTFAQVKALGPGEYRATIYLMGGKGVKAHVPLEIAGQLKDREPKPNPAQTPLTAQDVAEIAAKAAAAAVAPLVNEMREMRRSNDPGTAIVESFKVVKGIMTAVNDFSDTVAEQQEKKTRIAETRARAALAREMAYEVDDDEEQEDSEEETDPIERLFKQGAKVLENKGMKLLGGAKTPEAKSVENEWGVA